MEFKDKVVIVTGAASGIGAATALRFAELSAQLSLVDKNEEALKSSLVLCESKSKTKHLAIAADLSKTEDIQTVIPKTIERYGKIDVLVNAAGILVTDSILNDDLNENYEKIMAVNLKAPIMLCNKAAPFLVETKGSVVNVASVASSVPINTLPLYCVSKAGLEMFTKCMAKELSFKGVRANSIRPGSVRTNLRKNYDENMDIEKHYKERAKLLPFGIIEPKEVAGLIAFLASEAAKSITGSSYTIDGGYDLMIKEFFINEKLDK